MSSFEKLRNNIKLIVERGDVSLSDLARLSGLSRSLVRNYVEGNNAPGIDQIDRIAGALGVSTASLIGDEVPARIQLPDEPIDQLRLKAIELILKASPAKVGSVMVVLKGAPAAGKKSKASPA
jgi:transcriptional regulator with XRE-family HTH domain